MNASRRPLAAGTLYLLFLTFATTEHAELRATIATYALALFFGIVVGGIGELLARARRARPTRLHALALVAAVHAAFVSWSIADTPALWSDLLYAQGGLPRTVEVIAANTLGKSGIAIVVAVTTVVYVRPRWLVARVRRLLPLPLALVGACASGSARTTADDVVIVVVPRLRADRLDAMPALSRFARDSATRFDRAYVSRFDRAPSFSLPGYASTIVERGPARPPIRSPALWPVVGLLGRQGDAPLPRGDGKRLVTVVVEPREARGDDRYRGRYAYALPSRVTAPDADDVRQLRALDADAARDVDRSIAGVLAQIDLERTVVVVTALRGQSLFEHGRGYDPGLVGDESVHVPLLLHVPRVPGGRREGAIVRDVDVRATLHELTANAPPPEGRSLVREPLEPRPAFAEANRWSPDDMPPPEADPAIADVARPRMVRERRWKLVYVPRRSGVTSLLFDTEADPDEIHDVAAAHEDEVTRLRAQLFAWATRDGRLDAREGFLVPREKRAR